MVAQGLVAGGTGHGMIINFIPLFLTRQLGFDPKTSTFIFTAMLLAGIVGPLMFGRASDKAGRSRTTIFCALVTSAMLTALATIGSAGTFVLPVIFVLGLTAFSTMPLLETLLADVAKENREAVFGIYFTSAFIFNSLWIFAAGILVDATGSYTLPFILSAVGGVPAAIIVRKIGDRS